MKDHLEVTGKGSSRALALADADAQAAAYFGDTPRTRYIGRGICEVIRSLGGDRCTYHFEVDVAYITETR